uniref:Ribosomal protein L32 n=1 Tax=Romanomermis culicivorax TaxID=13658 RepID=A0A915KV48_ROMCU
MPTTKVKPKRCSKSLGVGFAIRLYMSVSRASRFRFSNK